MQQIRDIFCANSAELFTTIGNFAAGQVICPANAQGYPVNYGLEHMFIERTRKSPKRNVALTKKKHMGLTSMEHDD